MKNKDLIIKIARRLDKFSLDEIITISEFQEQEVKDILSDLLKTQVIIKKMPHQSLLRRKMDMKNF